MSEWALSLMCVVKITVRQNKMEHGSGKDIYIMGKKLDMLVEFFKAEDLIVGMQTWANTLPVKWLCSGSAIR